ncbi:hypothetical protein EHI8A_091340 [Entamoeba histolytica HM-1:IMSS-B]|uniref:Uncharacterized protein n=8 Tax=Entamoeba TaxID=5758 RepID=B1N314_ENTH1|nr:hypothetical protein EHI_007900 [Entamoeba histolytica HM-1:IMSS]XP_008856178.1 hypothetical protein ENU1_054290 [Entamoeba nuttalli P19]EMD48097.1 Hypothetical protein EHI5A_131870 [Entamoeba histolytica KU27]EMH75057.1 hypothetical protein EHI8A_091340 [Entamoeba histolytica HM-1:IMSS-B]EMS14844.1 hypothetical protein KM1_160180 [Entamoeba histolytica HM-3:IMSS]ENY65993.1 hypothetical protein EHI7A_089400 [Entamoeba histolytica HM-1:IMSS-A]GAT93819.1 hypothetical protein CL6EHI_007900 [E|eukprot:XP_008856178.1 hypothetical protein ENU1_054290 [Entamoeba nuttalli P19]
MSCSETPQEKEQIYENLMTEDQRYFEGKRNWLRQQSLEEIFEPNEINTILNALNSVDRLWENIYETKRRYHKFNQEMKENEDFLSSINKQFDEMEKSFLSSITQNTIIGKETN